MTAERPEVALLTLIDADDGSGNKRSALVRVASIDAIMDSPAGALVQIGGRVWICPDHGPGQLAKMVGWR